MTEYVKEVLDFITHNLNEDTKLSFGVGKWTMLYNGIPLANVELTDIMPFNDLRSSMPFFDVYNCDNILIMTNGSNIHCYNATDLLRILSLKET